MALSGVPVVSLTIGIELMNAILLPIVLGFLLALERVALPKELQMKGVYKWASWAMCGLVMSFGVYVGFIALLKVITG